nr:T9SS type A sorting domain-containing protein [Prolixibacteraceae bacterium]
ELNFQQSYLGGEIPAELFNLPSLTKAYLHQSGFTGSVPETVTNATQLVRFYIHENKLEGPLPVVEFDNGGADTKVNLMGNFFTFEEVKPYHDIKSSFAGFTDDYQLAKETEEVTADMGSSLTWSLTVEGGEAYSWFKDNIEVPVSTEDSYSIGSVSAEDQGVYVCKVQSSLVPNFDIRATYILNGGTVIPAIESAYSSEDGNTVHAAFNFEMADPSEEAANFVAIINGDTVQVTSATLSESDANVIELVLATAIPDKDATATLSYALGALEGSTGGTVAAFGPIDITNNVITGVNDLKLKMNIYPNPVADVLLVSGQSNIDKISIIDFSGKTVMQFNNLNNNNVSLPVQSIKSGIYLIKIESNKKQLVQKIIKK